MIVKIGLFIGFLGIVGGGCCQSAERDWTLEMETLKREMNGLSIQIDLLNEDLWGRGAVAHHETREELYCYKSIHEQKYENIKKEYEFLYAEKYADPSHFRDKSVAQGVGQFLIKMNLTPDECKEVVQRCLYKTRRSDDDRVQAVFKQFLDDKALGDLEIGMRNQFYH